MYHPNIAKEEVLEDDDAWKLVVPKERRLIVLKEIHDDPSAGHVGREKTFARVAQYYYWPRFYEDVAKYVRRCEVC